MSKLLDWPLLITSIGGALVLLGTIWTGIRSLKDQQSSTKASIEMTAALKEIAARSGDKSKANELIEIRSKLLAADRRSTDKSIRELVNALPTQVEEYKKLVNETGDLLNSRKTEFEIAWMPLLKFTISEFDRLILELSANNIRLEVNRDDNYRLIEVGERIRRGYQLRSVSQPHLTLLLELTSTYVYQSGSYNSTDLRLVIVDNGVRSTPMQLQMFLAQDRAFSYFLGITKLDNVPAPTEQNSQSELREAIRGSLIQGLQRFLVLSAAK